MHGAEPGREARKLFPIEPHFDELTSDTGPHPPPPQVERERWWPPDERLERDGLRNRSCAVYSHQRTLSRQKCPCGMVTWVCLNSSDEFGFDRRDPRQRNLLDRLPGPIAHPDASLPALPAPIRLLVT